MMHFLKVYENLQADNLRSKLSWRLNIERILSEFREARIDERLSY